MTPYGLGGHFATRLGERIRLKLRTPQAYGLFVILPGHFSQCFVSSQGFTRASADFHSKWQVDVPRLGIHVRLNAFFPHRPPRNTEILFVSMQDIRNIPMYLLSASHTNLESNPPI